MKLRVSVPVCGAVCLWSGGGGVSVVTAVCIDRVK